MKLCQNTIYVSSSLSLKGVKEYRFYTILSSLLFILTALTQWEFWYEFCNIIGSLVCATPSQAVAEIIRMLPLMITAWTELSIGLSVYKALRASNSAQRIRIWKHRGIAHIVMGCIIVLYVLLGVFLGTYYSFIEGYVTPLFPLDLAIGGLLIILFGMFSIRYSAVLRSTPSEYPYFANQHNRFLAVIRKPFYYLAYLIGTCSAAGFCYGLFTLDWSHGYIFFNLILLLNYLASAAMVIVYRFYYSNIQDFQKPAIMKKTALLFLIVNIILLALYFVAIQLQNEAPNQNAFSILPIEFTASFHAFPVIIGLSNILAPLTAIINGSLRKRKS